MATSGTSPRAAAAAPPPSGPRPSLPAKPPRLPIISATPADQKGPTPTEIRQHCVDAVAIRADVSQPERVAQHGKIAPIRRDRHRRSQRRVGNLDRARPRCPPSGSARQERGGDRRRGGRVSGHGPGGAVETAPPGHGLLVVYVQRTVSCRLSPDPPRRLV